MPKKGSEWHSEKEITVFSSIYVLGEAEEVRKELQSQEGSLCVMFYIVTYDSATEPLVTEATYYKKREGLGSPQWHFTTCIPQCFSQKSFLKRFASEKKVILIFQNIEKNLIKMNNKPG